MAPSPSLPVCCSTRPFSFTQPCALNTTTRKAGPSSLAHCLLEPQSCFQTHSCMKQMPLQPSVTSSPTPVGFFQHCGNPSCCSSLSDTSPTCSSSYRLRCSSSSCSYCGLPERAGKWRERYDDPHTAGTPLQQPPTQGQSCVS